jgi:hypothetical protein
VETIVKGEESEEQLSNYFDELRIIAEKMEVFPIDLIARKGLLTHCQVGSSYPEIAYRWELKRDAFRHFYDFCILALQAKERDIEFCIAHMDTLSPKEQSLVLTVIYIYILPWANEVPEKMGYGEQERLKTLRSWFALNYHNINMYERIPCDNKKCLFYKKIIENYISDQHIAFQEISLSKEQIEKNNVERGRLRIEINDIVKKNPDMGTSTKYRLYITDRKEFFNLIRKKYPNDYHQMISDRLYTSYTNDMFPINSGLIPKSGNASTTPKTVGQIAQQLIDSWDR